jgi:hypothetical protein
MKFNKQSYISQNDEDLSDYVPRNDISTYAPQKVGKKQPNKLVRYGSTEIHPDLFEPFSNTPNVQLVEMKDGGWACEGIVESCTVRYVGRTKVEAISKYKTFLERCSYHTQTIEPDWT